MSIRSTTIPDAGVRSGEGGKLVRNVALNLAGQGVPLIAALVAHGVQPDFVVGASVGAINANAAAASRNLHLDRIEFLLLTTVSIGSKTFQVSKLHPCACSIPPPLLMPLFVTVQ